MSHCYLLWCRVFFRHRSSRSKSWSLEAFAFIFTDPDFYLALRSGFILAFGPVIIAIPLGGILAFLMVRTDLPGRRIIEPLIPVPIFVSPMVLGFGYVVAAGPVGFFPVGAAADRLCAVEYLLDVQHCGHRRLNSRSACLSLYLFGAAQRRLRRGRGGAHRRRHAAAGDDLGESADGAAIHSLRLRVALFLGLEVFGLMLVLGDPEGNMVLATYLYKLTNKLGTPPTI